MRAGMIVVYPILTVMGKDLHLSTTSLSWLASIPLICFALAAPLSAYLRKLGDTNHVIGLALWILGISLLLRASGSTIALYIFTIFMGIAITLLNTSLPVWIKEHAGEHVGSITGIYVGIVGISATLAMALSAPLSALTSLSWKLSILPWGVIAVSFAIWWQWKMKNRDRSSSTSNDFVTFDFSLLRNSRAWQIAIFFSLQSALYYASATWFPTVLLSRGYDLNRAGYFTSLSALLGSIVGMAVPVLFRKYLDFRLVLMSLTSLILVGLTGVLLDTGPRLLLWLILISIGLSSTFPLVLFLCVIRAKNPSGTQSLSIMSQFVGYIVASLSPLIMGGLFDATGDWKWSIYYLIGLGAVQMYFSYGAGKPGTV